MADLRITDAPEKNQEDLTGEEKVPTGGTGNFSVSLDSIAGFTKTKEGLTTQADLDNAINVVEGLITTHENDSLNPHSVTKAQVGLDQVDNTADLDKPVSNSTRSAIITATQTKVEKSYVDNAIAALSTDGSKQYATLALANADIANISTNENVFISELDNGGYWYKATSGATSLTKSPYDPVNLAIAEVEKNPLYKPYIIQEGDNIDDLQTGIAFLNNSSVVSSVLNLPPLISTPKFFVIVTYKNGVVATQEITHYSVEQIEVWKRVGNGASSPVYKEWQKELQRSEIPSVVESYATVKTKDISNTSINNLQTKGGYRVTGGNLSTVTDLPFNSACDIQVFGETVTLWQIVKQFNSDNYALRSSNGGNPTIAWNAWKYLAFKSDIPVINAFPNPDLTSDKSTMFQATTIIESGVPVLVMTGGSSSVSQTMYDVDAVNAFSVGNTVTITGDVFADATGATTSADIALLFLDSSGSTLATMQAGKSGNANTYERLTTQRVVPANCTKIRIRMVRRTGATIAKFKNLLLQTTGQIVINSASASKAKEFNTVYVSTTGNDSNDGSLENPVLTFPKAVAMTGKNGKIIMRGGDYISTGSAGSFNISNVDYLHLTTHKNEKVRLIHGTRLNGITKTDGYNKVYQAPLASTPARYLWLHDVVDESTLILNAYRQPLQRGETHRLPSTKLWKTTSIELVDESTRPSFYYDSVSKVVYFSVPDSIDALSSTIYAPSNLFGLITGGTGVEDIEISGNITVMYSGLRGVDARNLKSFKHSNLFVFGSKGQGIVLDDTFQTEGKWARCAGNNDDGYNAHVYNVNTQCLHNCENLWTHDNGDDGESMHEYCVASYQNILSEFNGDRGAAPAYGAHCTYIGYVFQNNGQESIKDGGEGIACVGVSSEGVGTQALLFNGVSRGNIINYRTNAADASMAVIGGHSFSATDCGYDATVGLIDITNCGEQGSPTVKRGNVVVKNTALIV